MKNAPGSLISEAQLQELRTKNYSSRIIVAGSRGFSDRMGFARLLRHYLVHEHKGEHIAFISGDAPSGADRLIIEWSNVNPFHCYRFPANWDALGKSAGYVRNATMAKEATHLLAIWDGISSGTRHMLNIALKQGLHVKVAYFDSKRTNGQLNPLSYESYIA